MKKIILFFCLIFFLNNSFAETLNYKDLDKLSKINSFVDEKGKSYPIENIENKKNSIVIIYNHGSTNDLKKDSCKKKSISRIYLARCSCPSNSKTSQSNYKK